MALNKLLQDVIFAFPFIPTVLTLLASAKALPQALTLWAMSTKNIRTVH